MIVAGIIFVILVTGFCIYYIIKDIKREGKINKHHVLRITIVVSQLLMVILGFYSAYTNKVFIEELKRQTGAFYKDTEYTTDEYISDIRDYKEISNYRDLKRFITRLSNANGYYKYFALSKTNQNKSTFKNMNSFINKLYVTQQVLVNKHYSTYKREESVILDDESLKLFNDLLVKIKDIYVLYDKALELEHTEVDDKDKKLNKNYKELILMVKELRCMIDDIDEPINSL